MKPVPVVMVHGSGGVCPGVDQSYLPIVLRQAQEYNERVILLGDAANSHLEVEHHHYSDFYGEAQRFFDEEYIQYSTYKVGYDRFCMGFYFILKEFMQAHNFDVISNNDSDVMIYCDMTEEEQKLPKDYLLACCIPLYQPPFRWTASTHTSFITLEAIREICDFIHRVYTTPWGLEKIRSKWDFQVEHSLPGGICDMTMIYLFEQERRGERIVNLTPVIASPTQGAFSHKLSGDENGLQGEYRLAGRYKELTWIDDQPYCYNLRLDAWVRFKTVHFQGGAKRFITASFREAKKC